MHSIEHAIDEVFVELATFFATPLSPYTTVTYGHFIILMTAIVIIILLFSRK